MCGESKKRGEGIKKVCTWVILVIVFSITLFNIVFSISINSGDKALFGYRFYLVASDSMAATDFKAGDVVISKSVDLDELKVGDIITFISDSSVNYGRTVTHKIRKITKDENGKYSFQTYGTATDADDDAPATKVLGKYVGRLKGFGKFITFSKKPIGYVVLIFLPFAVLLTIQLINCIRLFKKIDEAEKGENEKIVLGDAKNENVCVICGEVIPEGLQICYKCSMDIAPECE